MKSKLNYILIALIYLPVLTMAALKLAGLIGTSWDTISIPILFYFPGLIAIWLWHAIREFNEPSE